MVFEEANHPRHDGDTIYLPRIRADMTEDELEEIMTSVDHEVSHDEYSDFGILQDKKIDTQTTTGFIWNLIEDSRVNALEATEYWGFKELWNKTTPKLMEQILPKLASGDPMSEALHGLIRWEAKVSADIFPACYVQSLKFKNDKKLEAVLEPFSDRLVECQHEPNKVEGTLLTYNLARDIVKALGGDPDKEEEESKKRAKERKEGKGEEGEKVEGKPAKGKKAEKAEGKEEKEKETAGEEAVLDEDALGKDDDDEDWCIKKVKIAPEDYEKLLTTHDIEFRGSMSKVGLLYDTERYSSGWTMTPLEQFAVVNYHLKTASHPRVQSLLTKTLQFEKDYNNRVDNKFMASENFAQLIRKEIQVRTRVKYQYGVKHGKLDQARLARIVVQAPGYSDRVFKNKIQSTALDAAVSILIDMSGSMSGDKALYATGAAVLMNKVFQVLQLPLEISGFTDCCLEETVPLQYIYKPFSNLFLSKEELISRIGASSRCMTGNPDGENILYSYNSLLKRKEKKRLLIVMSDGQPAATKRTSGLGRFTKQIIEEIEARKQVEIYGLGLCTYSVKEYYTQCSVIKEASEIPDRLLELIQRKLLSHV